MAEPGREVRTVLVTGGAGFIGCSFVRWLLARRPDWRVVVLDKLTYAGSLDNLEDVLDDPRLAFHQGDVADPTAVAWLLAAEPVDIVVHMAAESHVDRSLHDSTVFVRTNVEGTQVLLEAVRRAWSTGPEGHGRLFVQLSTDEVYGSIDSGSWTEEAPLAPRNPYAASKAAAELLCQAYGRSFAFPVAVVRSSNVYGPYQFPEKLIPLSIHRALAGESLPLYGRGDNVRDWLYVEDLCRALAAVIAHGEPGQVFNVGGGNEQPNREIMERVRRLVAEHTGKDPVPIENVPDRPGHDFRYALDCAKANRELGWTPQQPFDEGLAETVVWYVARRAWLARAADRTRPKLEAVERMR